MRVLPLKSHFLMAVLVFLAMCFMVQRGFIYTIAVVFYAFRCAFCCILHCVLLLFSLRLAAKCTTFSGKMQCV